MKHIKMPRELANKWLVALRSGKYKQGTHTLRSISRDNTEDRYCCLGVLQMVAEGETEGLTLPTRDWLTRHRIFFRDEAGDSATNPFLVSLGDSVASCNDSGLSFKFIADAIEDEIEST